MRSIIACRGSKESKERLPVALFSPAKGEKKKPIVIEKYATLIKVPEKLLQKRSALRLSTSSQSMDDVRSFSQDFEPLEQLCQNKE